MVTARTGREGAILYNATQICIYRNCVKKRLFAFSYRAQEPPLCKFQDITYNQKQTLTGKMGFVPATSLRWGWVDGSHGSIRHCTF